MEPVRFFTRGRFAPLRALDARPPASYCEAMRYVLPMILYVGLTVYVIADIAQHPDEEPYRLPKTLWVLIALFAPFIGAGAWIVTKIKRGKAPGTGRGGYSAPRAPDDDPNFRVWLNEQERRRRQDGRDK